MWSSCPEPTPLRRRALATAVPIAALLAGSAPLWAAQVYVQPVITLSEEYDSNLELDPTVQQANIGYSGDAATLIGIAGPNSDISIKPRLRYESYPNETELNRLEGMFDFNTSYSTQRSRFNMFGRFDHLNDTEAEIPSAVYNDVNPFAPTVTQTGQIDFKATRNNVWAQPSYSWRLSPLMNVGVAGVFQSQNFSPADAFSHVDFTYYQGAVTFGGDLSQRTSFQLEGYTARYRAKNITSTATSNGGSAGLTFNWSQIATAGVSAQYQHSQINALQPTPFHGPANTWGASANAQWRLQSSEFRINAGRIITPSSGGGLYVAEQAQTEYDKDLTERLSFTGALLYSHSTSLVGAGAGVTSNYRRADVSLKWMLARTWFVQGGYGYVWDKYSAYLAGALDNLAYLRFGYQGLPRRY